MNKLLSEGRWLESKLATLLDRRSPWTNITGLSRSLLALATALTLLVNSPAILFRQGSGLSTAVQCPGISQHISLFCIVPLSSIQVARFIAIAILLVVASGWRPAWTAIPHWWIAFSFFTSGTILDGGEEVTAVITLLLIPFSLFDTRPSHFSSSMDTSRERRLIGLSALTAIRIQAAFIYGHAFIGKMANSDWLDGTGMYYWFTNPSIGLNTVLKPLLLPVLLSKVVVPLTWSVLTLECVLAAALFLNQRNRMLLLVVAVIFHFMIGVLIGIASFSLAMIAVLLLYLPDPGNNLQDIRHALQSWFTPTLSETDRANLANASAGSALTKVEA